MQVGTELWVFMHSIFPACTCKFSGLVLSQMKTWMHEDPQSNIYISILQILAYIRSNQPAWSYFQSTLNFVLYVQIQPLPLSRLNSPELPPLPKPVSREHRSIVSTVLNLPKIHSKSISWNCILSVCNVTAYVYTLPAITLMGFNRYYCTCILLSCSVSKCVYIMSRSMFSILLVCT